MDRGPKGGGGNVHLCELHSRTTVLSILEQYETSQCFRPGLGNAGFWTNCGCYCCLAKQPTVMLQIRCESLTPCLYQRKLPSSTVRDNEQM